MHFLKIVPSAFGVALVAAILASPVAAGDNDKKPKDGKHDKGSVATPAPIAGVGMIGVIVAGGVTYLVRRRRRKPDQD